MDRAAEVAELRARGLNAYAISCALGISLSEVRRAEDAKAQRAHELWAGSREAADDAERLRDLIAHPEQIRDEEAA